MAEKCEGKPTAIEGMVFAGGDRMSFVQEQPRNRNGGLNNLSLHGQVGSCLDVGMEYLGILPAERRQWVGLRLTPDLELDTAAPRLTSSRRRDRRVSIVARSTESEMSSPPTLTQPGIGEGTRPSALVRTSSSSYTSLAHFLFMPRKCVSSLS